MHVVRISHVRTELGSFLRGEMKMGGSRFYWFLHKPTRTIKNFGPAILLFGVSAGEIETPLAGNDLSFSRLVAVAVPGI